MIPGSSRVIFGRLPGGLPGDFREGFRGRGCGNLVLMEQQKQCSVVIASTAFTFDTPCEPASVQTQLRFGAVVEALETRAVESQGWTRVAYGWGVRDRFDEAERAEEGWLRSSSVVVASPQGSSAEAAKALQIYLDRPVSDPPRSSEPAALTASASWLQVRSLAAHGFAKPSRTAGPSVVVVPFEAWVWGVELTDAQAAPGAYGSRWWRVLLPDGREVFIQSGDLASGGLSQVADGETMIQPTAMLGRPYVWGGSTSFGYDCSGLVQMAARRRGVALPHSARRQFSETFAGLSPVGEDLAIEDVVGEVRSDGGRGEACSAMGLRVCEAGRAAVGRSAAAGRCGVLRDGRQTGGPRRAVGGQQRDDPRVEFRDAQRAARPVFGPAFMRRG